MVEPAHSSGTPVKVSLSSGPERSLPLFSEGSCFSGEGLAVNMSSGGVLVASERHQSPVGALAGDED